jgi:hypothetical protein
VTAGEEEASSYDFAPRLKRNSCFLIDERTPCRAVDDVDEHTEQMHMTSEGRRRSNEGYGAQEACVCLQEGFRMNEATGDDEEIAMQTSIIIDEIIRSEGTFPRRRRWLSGISFKVVNGFIGRRRLVQVRPMVQSKRH